MEVFTEKEWWDAQVVVRRDAMVLVHYVGSTEEEDEWIQLNSKRIRPPCPATASPVPSPQQFENSVPPQGAVEYLSSPSTTPTASGAR